MVGLLLLELFSFALLLRATKINVGCVYNSRLLAASSAVRKAFVVRCISNFDQSVGASPVADSWYVLRSR